MISKNLLGPFKLPNGVMQGLRFVKLALCFNFIWLVSVSKAQVVPDSTMGTKVTPSLVKGVPSTRIDGGTIRRTTLFHSFDTFNIGKGQRAYFTNPANVQNILSRVTGGSPSEIIGRLGVMGNANLILINPSGIIFGSDVRLNLKSSFLASTASSIQLADGTQFSAINSVTDPLLNVSVPMGLVFTHNPGSIQVLGKGHNLSVAPKAPFFTNGAGASTTGLRVLSGKTVALVGGDVYFAGGIVSAPSGRVEVGSVRKGQVNIAFDQKGFTLDYANTQNLKGIELTKLSLLDVSGVQAGNIRLYGKQILLSDGSKALSQNAKPQPSVGTITVDAKELLKIAGTTARSIFKDPATSAQIRSSLLSQSLSGQGTNITVTTKDLFLESTGGIVTSAFNSAKGGNISIKASGNIQVTGFSPFDPLGTSNNSLIATTTLGSNKSKAGDVLISTNSLFLKESGSVVSGSYGGGDAGKVVVNAAKLVDADGVNLNTLVPSILSSITFGDGNAGDVEVITRRLSIKNGARVDSSTLSSGSAGSVRIRALDQVEVDGTLPIALNPSQIISSGNIVDPIIQKLFGLPPIPSGDAGDLEISTQNLIVNNGGQVTVKNDGTGNAGSLVINAGSVNLNNQSGITASTAGGEGGNVRLQVQDLLRLENQSYITANAQGQGIGGNITIDASLLVAFNNSDITANAQEKSGGQVLINSQSVFGTEFRNQLTQESDITASSDLGPQFSGTVEINTPDVDFAKATAPPVVQPESPRVSSACQANSDTGASSLSTPGAGGIPATPSDPFTSVAGWNDNSSARKTPANNPQSVQPTVNSGKFVEAQGWVSNSDGTLSMTTSVDQAVPYSSFSSPACQNKRAATNSSTSK